MKKVSVIFLCLVMVFGIMYSVYATEVNSEENENNNEDSIQLTEEELQELLASQETSEEKEKEEEKNYYLTATVISIEEPEEKETYYGKIKMQNVKVKLLDGEKADQEFDSVFYLSQDYSGLFLANALKVGDKVYVELAEEQIDEEGNTEIVAYVLQKTRHLELYILIGIFAVVIILLSRFKGLETLSIILLNTVIIVGGYLYMYLQNVNSYLALFVMAIAIIISNILIINKFKKESFIAIITALISTILTFAVLLCVKNFVGIIGLTEYASYLNGVTNEITFSYLDLILGAMVLASVGATIEMSLKTMSASIIGKTFFQTLQEVSKELPSKLNSVYLIWITNFITMFVVFYLYGRPIQEIINVETITIEIVKILVILINPVIVMPIGILIGKEFLKTRAIQESKEV